MSSLAGLLHDHCALAPDDVAWLHRLVGDWQTLADVAYTDLLLWVPTRDGRFVNVALCRPATASTGYLFDPVGEIRGAQDAPELVAALAGRHGYSVGARAADVVLAEPVVREGRQIGAVTMRERGGVLKLSPLERAYLTTADDLVAMLREGAYPDTSAPTGAQRGAPRVGDGLVRLDADGVVTFASPNALSAFHRLGYLGGLVGESLPEVVTPLIQQSGLVDETLPLVITGRASMRAQVLSPRDVAVSLRSIPLTRGGRRHAAVILCRDVTEVHRGERELMTKDATIREIHHRVKNNLQTVSALLRMQARRIEAPDAKEALEEAMRRVATIALVHETLSLGLEESLDLDSLLRKVVDLVRPLVVGGDQAHLRVSGFGGLVPAKQANALALIVMELVANSIEHAAAPEHAVSVAVDLQRLTKTEDEATSSDVPSRDDGESHDDELLVTVSDDGVGLPVGFAPGDGGLGTQIVRALVTGELGGQIAWTTPEVASGERAGTVVWLRCPIPVNALPVS